MTDGLLQSHLAALRRRVLLIGGLAGLGWGWQAQIGVWLALVWLDLAWKLAPAVRVAVDIAAVLVGMSVLTSVVRAAIRSGRAAALARRLDAAAGAGGQIVAGYDLAAAPLADEASGGSELTRGLALMTVQQAGRLAEAAPRAQAAPWRVLRIPLGGVAIVTILLVAVVLLAPRLAQTQWLRFSDPFGDHPPYSLVEFQVDPGNARVLYGARLDVSAAAIGPALDRVDLVLQTAEGGEEALPMFPEPAGRWRTVLTGVTEPARYFVRAGRSRSHRFQLDVITTPKLADVKFRVQLPAYTRRPAYEGPLPTGGLSGLAGTRVDVWAESNRPLSGGQVQLVADSADSAATSVSLRPVAAGADEVTGVFELNAAGKFMLEVVDVDGTASTEKLTGAITLIRDEQPFVRILQPPAMSLATPEATLPVQVAGEDDFGVARLQLMRSLNDSRATPMELQTPQPAVTRFDGDVVMPLSAYGLSPGDVIKLFARVEDNDPAGPKASESPIAVVQIISQAQFEKMLRTQQGLEMLMSKYREAERRLAALAEEEEGLRKRLHDAKDEKLSPDHRDSMKKFAQRLRREAREVRESTKELLPIDLDKNLVQHLAALAADLESEADQLEQQGDSPDLTPEQAAKLLDDLLDKLAKRRKQLGEEVTEPLAHLEKIYPLIEDQSRFEQLYRQQRDLAERLASLQGRDGEDDPQVKNRMRGLETEQRKLHQALEELLSDIESHAQQLPDDERLEDLRASALKFVDEVRGSGAAEAMTDAETGLAAFSGTQGHAGAVKAADILEEYLSKCQGMQQAGKGCLKFQPKLAASLGASIEQLLAEAGLGGTGDGGSGYSTRRSTLDNTGLFGKLPGVDQMAGKTGRKSGSKGRSLADGRTPHDPKAMTDETVTGGAAGSSEAAVPARYRGRVGAYFQRIAEESNNP